MIFFTIFCIIICICFSALFSGLNLGFFGLSRLKLEVESESGNKAAMKILSLRRDSNFLLTTLLWGNVSVNCLITLLSESVLAGLGAFLFSTFGITFFGEIIPQAFFSRHTLKVAKYVVPLIKIMQIILYPVAKPSAFFLDKWLGKEGIILFRESQFKIMLEKHIDSSKSDIGRLEGLGAINFLSLDDIKIGDEGELIDPQSIIPIKVKNNLPDFPNIKRIPDDDFLKKVNSSNKKWVVLVNEQGFPRFVLNSDGFLRDALYGNRSFNPFLFCHRPIIIENDNANLGNVINKLKVHPEHAEDDVIDNDIIIYWGKQKRIITGADIFGRLLRGIVKREYNPRL